MRILEIAEKCQNGRLGTLPNYFRLAGPFGLVSLLDMLRVYAGEFHVLTSELNAMLMHLALATKKYRNKPPAELEAICKATWSFTRSFLDRFERTCVKLELEAAAKKVSQIRTYDAIETGGVKSYDLPDFLLHLEHDIAELPELVFRQFPDQTFMFVPKKDAWYLGVKLFGETVYNRFPKLRDDIAQAGKCLAMSDPNGTIYHLMRVLEFVVKRLIKNAGGSTNGIQTLNFAQLLGLIDTAIKNIKTKTARNQKYSAAVAHLRHCKNAWRDPVSHTRKNFTETQAIDVFRNVKMFVNSLAGGD
jgi:hypothetical protein